MNIIIFLAVLVLLIVVHEFGHFIVAKRSGIRVDEFGIGFPPRALTFWKRGETIYTLNWFPIGGFVKIFGENPDEESTYGPDKERSLAHKPRHVQAAVLSAGVAFNILLAWIIFFTVFLIGTPTVVTDTADTNIKDKELQILSIIPDSPAEEADLQAGDTVSSLLVGGVEILNPTYEDFTRFIEMADSGVTMTVIRGVETLEKKVYPVAGLVETDPEKVAVGVGIGIVGTLKLPPHLALFEATKFTGGALIAITIALLGFFASAFTLSADLSQVAGPVGIVGLVGDAASLGIVSLMMFTAFISLNLAVINLLPIPALDGGRLLFVAIEAIKRKPIQPKVANTLNTLGFIFLILLMVAVTYNDILRIVQ